MKACTSLWSVYVSHGGKIIVEVDGDATHTVYLEIPFHEKPDFTAISVNYYIVEIISSAETVYND